MVESTHAAEEEGKDQTFLELPAILDMYKASAAVADCT